MIRYIFQFIACISFLFTYVYPGLTEDFAADHQLDGSIDAVVHGSVNNSVVIQPMGHTT